MVLTAIYIETKSIITMVQYSLVWKKYADVKAFIFVVSMFFMEWRFHFLATKIQTLTVNLKILHAVASRWSTFNTLFILFINFT